MSQFSLYSLISSMTLQSGNIFFSKASNCVERGLYNRHTVYLLVVPGVSQTCLRIKLSKGSFPIDEMTPAIFALGEIGRSNFI